MSSTGSAVSERPDARVVMIRRLILTNFFVKARVTPPEDTLVKLMTQWKDEQKNQFEEKFRIGFTKQIDKMREQGLWEHTSEPEKQFFEVGVLETTTRQRIDASWMVESIICLDWALQRRPEIAPYDQETSPDSVRFKEGERASDLIGSAVLHPDSKIDAQREIAQLWHWRCRTHMLLKSSRIPERIPNGPTMEEVIRLTAEDAAREGIIPPPIDHDFPALGKPFRDLSEEEFQQVMSISMERHKALNWLCGYAPENQWAETPTDT